jgi:hypothetical protein
VQVSDRDEFESLLGKLYAGYNMPISKARTDAYFAGLAKMPLSQFARCVEHCLGEGGPDKIPSVPAMWGIRKKLTTPAAVFQPPKEEPDHLQWFANRLLMLHIATRGGLGSTGRFVPGEAHLSGMNDCTASVELDAYRKVKADMVEFYEELIREGSPHANPSSFVGDWVKQLSAVSKITPKGLAEYTRFIALPEFKRPFAASMIRKIA